MVTEPPTARIMSMELWSAPATSMSILYGKGKSFTLNSCTPFLILDTHRESKRWRCVIGNLVSSRPFSINCRSLAKFNCSNFFLVICLWAAGHFGIRWKRGVAPCSHVFEFFRFAWPWRSLRPPRPFMPLPNFFLRFFLQTSRRLSIQMGKNGLLLNAKRLDIGCGFGRTDIGCWSDPASAEKGRAATSRNVSGSTCGLKRRRDKGASTPCDANVGAAETAE
mmetsp:Transcript_31444/g.91929  ORF Transcript_31444/g.91929 Transcript_31444/m.91929 type:complete len:222 (+) Transcript_31444:302-967(+)